MNFKRGSNLGCVPPPDCLKTNTNKSQQQSSSYHTMSSIMSNRSQQNQMPSDEAKRKEEQYAALVFSSYGSSSAAHSSAATKRKNIYDDEYPFFTLYSLQFLCKFALSIQMWRIALYAICGTRAMINFLGWQKWVSWPKVLSDDDLDGRKRNSEPLNWFGWRGLLITCA